MTQEKKKRGRPSIYDHRGKPDGNLKETMEMLYQDMTDRQRASYLYSCYGSDIISEAASEIPDYKTINRKVCITEQIGRMFAQDGYSREDCKEAAIIVGILWQRGRTAKEIAAYIRQGRLKDWRGDKKS